VGGEKGTLRKPDKTSWKTVKTIEIREGKTKKNGKPHQFCGVPPLFFWFFPTNRGNVKKKKGGHHIPPQLLCFPSPEGGKDKPSLGHLRRCFFFVCGGKRGWGFPLGGHHCFCLLSLFNQNCKIWRRGRGSDRGKTWVFWGRPENIGRGKKGEIFWFGQIKEGGGD